MTIRHPATSCGYTIASVNHERLTPSERGTIVFTLNLGSFSRGPVEKHIYVQTDSPGATGVILTVKANLVPLYDTEPMQLSFGELRVGESTNGHRPRLAQRRQTA